jgi:DNA-binding NarL/FixJ family response regulator
LHEVLAGGARGYVLKSDAARHLVAAIEALLAHEPFFPLPASSTPVGGRRQTTDRPAQGAAPPSVLTAREREVVQHLAEGRTGKETAAALGISAKTVETHRAAIMRKLGLRSVVELVRYAIRNQMVAL